MRGNTRVVFWGELIMAAGRLRRALVLAGLAGAVAATAAPVQAAAHAEATPAEVQRLPLPAVRDDYPAASLAAYGHQTVAAMTECGAFALWRVDRDRGRHWTSFDTFASMISTPDRAAMMAGAAGIDDVARDMGTRVDGQPNVGSIGILEPGENGAGSAGHAFYVARVLAFGRLLLIEQYNWAGHGEYSTAVVPAGWARSYVHFESRPASTP